LSVRIRNTIWYNGYGPSATAVDAITSDRPYRAGRPFEVAIEELTRMRGTQFDPTVVDAALEITPAGWQRIRHQVEEERRKKRATVEAG